jgi:hypothetical protein
LADEAPPGMMVEDTVLDRVVDQAVRGLWQSRVKTFVPILALRQAREVLREQDLLITREPQVHVVATTATTIVPPEERPRRDVFPIADDVMRLDDRDVLSL